MTFLFHLFNFNLLESFKHRFLFEFDEMRFFKLEMSLIKSFFLSFTHLFCVNAGHTSPSSILFVRNGAKILDVEVLKCVKRIFAANRLPHMGRYGTQEEVLHRISKKTTFLIKNLFLEHQKSTKASFCHLNLLFAVNFLSVNVFLINCATTLKIMLSLKRILFPLIISSKVMNFNITGLWRAVLQLMSWVRV